MAPTFVSHCGGCHCGAVTFEVDAPAALQVSECNCSICAPVAFQHLIVPRSRFRLLTGLGSISTYTFGTGVAKHTFCKVCGIKSFYTPRSNPDGVSVNARCLVPDTVASVTLLEPFNGRDAWEASAARAKHLSE